MSVYDQTVSSGIHVGAPPRSLEEIQALSRRTGQLRLDFSSAHHPERGYLIIAGDYQMRMPFCVLHTESLLSQFDDETLGKLIMELLAPWVPAEDLTRWRSYAELGSTLREAMTDVSDYNLVIVWVMEGVVEDHMEVWLHVDKVKK